jgi:hypothetical protein
VAVAGLQRDRAVLARDVAVQRDELEVVAGGPVERDRHGREGQCARDRLRDLLELRGQRRIAPRDPGKVEEPADAGGMLAGWHRSIIDRSPRRLEPGEVKR